MLDLERGFEYRFLRVLKKISLKSLLNELGLFNSFEK